MIKFTNKIDISNSRLLVTSGVIGFASILTSRILVAQHDFSKIGFYFSEYTGSVVTVLPQEGYQLNGEVFFNEKKRILILSLASGVPSYYTKKFFTEFNNFVTENTIKDVLFTSGILPEYQNDSEITSTVITPYFLSNDEEVSKVLESSGAISFVKYCNLVGKKKKNSIDEVHYASGTGLASNYIKHQAKSKLKYNFLGVYIRTPLDILAAITFVNTLCYYYGFVEKPLNLLEKKYQEVEKLLTTVSGVSTDWNVLTNLDSF
jgi:predicted ATP-grasp superfamily ATP-dependent carboligase